MSDFYIARQPKAQVQKVWETMTIWAPIPVSADSQPAPAVDNSQQNKIVQFIAAHLVALVEK